MSKIVKCTFPGCTTPNIIVADSPGTIVASTFKIDESALALLDEIEKEVRLAKEHSLKEIKKLFKKHNIETSTSIDESTDYMVVFCDQNHKNYIFLKNE